MENPIQPSKYTGNEAKYLKEVLERGVGAEDLGAYNKRFEQAFAEKFGVKYAIAHNSGTSALHSCLMAAGVGQGDEVISPALTVVMNTFATLYQGAVPVYADVDPKTFLIDPRDIEKKITPKTKAIFTVSLYGLSPDMDPIMELARKHNLVVIEDNAQCYFGKYKGRLAGTLGHMAIFSLEKSKHLSVSEGGIVITNDENMADRVRKFSGLGYWNLSASEGSARANKEALQDPSYKRHDTLGFNYRMSEPVAALALAQTERVEEIVSRRQQIASMYARAIEGCSWLIAQEVPDGYTHAYWTYVAKYEGEEQIGVTWKDFYNAYKEMGGDGFYAAWSIPYLEPVIAEKKYMDSGSVYHGATFKYEKGYCPIAEEIQQKAMQFKTNYTDLELAKRKAEALKKTIDKYGN